MAYFDISRRISAYLCSVAISLSPHHHRQSSKLARSSPSVDQPRLIRRVGWLHHISKDSGSRWSSRGAGTFLPICLINPGCCVTFAGFTSSSKTPGDVGAVSSRCLFGVVGIMLVVFTSLVSLGGHHVWQLSSVVKRNRLFGIQMFYYSNNTLMIRESDPDGGGYMTTALYRYKDKAI